MVTLPGMRENLLTLTARSNPPFGRMSPVSRVKRPGLPSRAGIGFHLGAWSALSCRAADGAFGAGFAAGTAAAPFAGAETVAVATGWGAASFELSVAGFAGESLVATVVAAALPLASVLSPCAWAVE